MSADEAAKEIVDVLGGWVSSRIFLCAFLLLRLAFGRGYRPRLVIVARKAG